MFRALGLASRPQSTQSRRRENKLRKRPGGAYFPLYFCVSRRSYLLRYGRVPVPIGVYEEAEVPPFKKGRRRKKCAWVHYFLNVLQPTHPQKNPTPHQIFAKSNPPIGFRKKSNPPIGFLRNPTPPLDFARNRIFNEFQAGNFFEI